MAAGWSCKKLHPAKSKQSFMHTGRERGYLIGGAAALSGKWAYNVLLGYRSRQRLLGQQKTSLGAGTAYSPLFTAFLMAPDQAALCLLSMWRGYGLN